MGRRGSVGQGSEAGSGSRAGGLEVVDVHRAFVCAGPERSGSTGISRRRPGAVGPVRIAPPAEPSQGERAIPQGSIQPQPPKVAGARPGRTRPHGLYSPAWARPEGAGRDVEARALI